MLYLLGMTLASKQGMNICHPCLRQIDLEDTRIQGGGIECCAVFGGDDIGKLAW